MQLLFTIHYAYRAYAIFALLWANDVLKPPQIRSRFVHNSYKKLETGSQKQGAVRSNTNANAWMNGINSKGLILPLQFSRAHPASKCTIFKNKHRSVYTSNIVYSAAMHGAACAQVYNVYVYMRTRERYT